MCDERKRTGEQPKLKVNHFLLLLQVCNEEDEQHI